MCKLIRRIVKLITSMSARPIHRHRSTVGPAPAPSRESVRSSAIIPASSVSVRGTTYPAAHVPNETVPSRSKSDPHLPRNPHEHTSVEQGEPEQPERSVTSPSKERGSMSLSEGEGSGTIDEPKPFRKQDARQQDHDRHRTDDRWDAPRSKTSHPSLTAISVASTSKDYGFSKEGEGSKMRDEPRPLDGPDRRRYDHDMNHTDDRRDISRGVWYPSLKENHDITRPPLVHTKGVESTTLAPPDFQTLWDAQSRELSMLRHEHRVAVEEKKALADTHAALQLRYEERTKKLTAVRHERQHAFEQRKRIDDAYAALRLQYDEQLKKLNTVRQERQSALEQTQAADEARAALQEKYDAQKNEYSALSNKYHSLKATLEQRTLELQGVQRFLTTADTFSGAEVINMLRKLNEDVQQTTTYMAEWAVENFTFETPQTDQLTTEDIEQTRTYEYLGMRLMQLLGTRKHKDNPILLEMAFRAYLVYSLYWIASPWSMGQEEQAHNVYIDTIYQRMRETEGQAVSGNWRALTRAYTLPACITDPELAQTLDTTIVSGLSDILLAAGCAGAKTDMITALWSQFAEKIHHFVLLAGEVNRAVGVGVISEDFEVLVVWPDTVFDDRQMEDSYDSGERVQGKDVDQVEDVLCATDLGLMQRIKVGAGAGQKGKPSELVVMKPKVALMSVLDIIDG